MQFGLAVRGTKLDFGIGILERAADRLAVLRAFAIRFRPSSWSGSLATILEGRKALLEELEKSSDTSVVEFAVAEGVRLSKQVEAERDFEAAHDRVTDERFE